MSDKLKIDYGLHQATAFSEPVFETMKAMASTYARVFHNPALNLTGDSLHIIDHRNTIAHGCLDAYL